MSQGLTSTKPSTSVCSRVSVVYPTLCSLTMSGNKKMQSLCRLFVSHSELGTQQGLEMICQFRTMRLAKFILTVRYFWKAPSCRNIFISGAWAQNKCFCICKSQRCGLVEAVKIDVWQYLAWLFLWSDVGDCGDLIAFLLCPTMSPHTTMQLIVKLSTGHASYPLHDCADFSSFSKLHLKRAVFPPAVALC